MQNKIIFQMVYAEATGIVYDQTRIQQTRTALYRLANFYGIDPKPLMQSIKANRKAVRDAAKALSAQGDLQAAVSVMGTVSTQLGHLAGHVHAPLEETNIPQIATDIFGFLNTLAVLDKLPTAKVA